MTKQLSELPKPVLNEIYANLFEADQIIYRVLDTLKRYNINVDPREIEFDEISDKKLTCLNQGADGINRAQLNFADMI